MKSAFWGMSKPFIAGWRVNGVGGENRLTSIHAKPASQTAAVYCQVTCFFVSGPGHSSQIQLMVRGDSKLQACSMMGMAPSATGQHEATGKLKHKTCLESFSMMRDGEGCDSERGRLDSLAVFN